MTYDPNPTVINPINGDIRVFTVGRMREVLPFCTRAMDMYHYGDVGFSPVPLVVYPDARGPHADMHRSVAARYDATTCRWLYPEIAGDRVQVEAGPDEWRVYYQGASLFSEPLHVADAALVADLILWAIEESLLIENAIPAMLGCSSLPQIEQLARRAMELVRCEEVAFFDEMMQVILLQCTSPSVVPRPDWMQWPS